MPRLDTWRKRIELNMSSILKPSTYPPNIHYFQANEYEKTLSNVLVNTQSTLLPSYSTNTDNFQVNEYDKTFPNVLVNNRPTLSPTTRLHFLTTTMSVSERTVYTTKKNR